MSFSAWRLALAVEKLRADGYTQEEINAILSGAQSGNYEAQQQVIAASKATSPGINYDAVQRPRLLENGLPFTVDYAQWALILYLMKTDRPMLKDLLKKFMDTQAKIITSLAQAGTGNMITGYAHSFLIGLMLEQNYMIRERGADDLIASLNVLVGATQLISVLQGFAVPEVITFAGQKAFGIPEREAGK